MVKHIVAWKFAEINKEENMLTAKKMLEALTDKIPQIKSLEVGINENAGEFDIILLSDFESCEALEIYDSHAEHAKVKEFIKAVALKREAVDYKY